MNSIDHKALRALTDPLFEAITQDINPELSPFPLGPDTKMDSYYTQRTRCTMTPPDFRAASCLDADEFGRCLGTYWRAVGHPKLAVRTQIVVEAARALHVLQLEAQPELEVSPLIYQMF
jgi:hypothetical protein